MSGPATIPEALFATAETGAGEYRFYLDDATVRLSCAELAEQAEQAARRLVALGVEPGDAVGLLGPNRPDWVIWAFAAWIAGATLVPIQIPLRIRNPDAFREQLQMLVDAGGCRRVLADPQIAALLSGEIAVAWDLGGPTTGEELPGAAPESTAVIQFTSGSTASPKGVLLTHAAVMAQMELLRRGYRHDDETPRTVLSWAPFFHDLGLFANVVHPAFAGSTTYHLPTERFAKDPAEWLRLVEATGVELTVGPSSAFGSAIKAAARTGERIDLGSLEVAYFAAEGVDPRVAQRMVEDAQTFGFRPEALGATYGLAEAVLGVAYPYIGTGLKIDRISLDELAASGSAVPASEGALRTVASCGPPLMELRIAGRDGVLPERGVGEIQVRGPSLMSRYVGADVPHPIDDEGWLSTGDLGYLADGDLYVSGRAKDLMIAMGNNYYPEDFEWAAARVEGVKPGRCVAFNPPGTEEVVVLVEATAGEDAESLRAQVRRMIGSAVGVPPGEVVVLPAGSVEKTTSGKLRRAAMRSAYADGALTPVGA